MLETEFVSTTCVVCGTEKVTLDEHYKLPKCHEFIVLCPKHPSKVFFDLPIEDIKQIANSD